jgi:hypothetical protein
MPLPSASSALLAKCSSTLLCYLRAAPLWAFALLVLLLGAVRHHLLPRRAPALRSAPDKKDGGQSTAT